MLLAHSPVQTVELFGAPVYLKRDDLLHHAFGGNKARKFAALLEHNFDNVELLVGHGSPQANSLYTMAALAQLKGCQLDFYVDHIAGWLKSNPNGNYRAALELGANIVELAALPDAEGLSVAEYISTRVLPEYGEEGTRKVLFVPEGGRCGLAEAGVNQLAKELVYWQQQQGLGVVNVVLPAGTGTTALFLSRYFTQHHHNLKVFTVAAVGGDDYLKLQFNELDSDESCHPQIVSLGRKYHFGKLYRAFYDIWQEANSSGVTFELLYDPLGLMALKQLQQQYNDGVFLYVHQGGVLGNETMLPRYKRKYGIELG